jgi:SAM-dependent methyltransferase
MNDSHTTASDGQGALFGERYYATGCGADYRRNEGWLRFFSTIAGHIVKDVHPATVLDAGCAMGFLVEALRAQGVEAWGVDVSDYAISQVHPSVRAFCAVGSITAPFERTYDLITCIEVLEHLDKAEGQRAIENLCCHTDDVLFSSTPHDFTEATHFNVQPPEYWAEQFARHGFYHDLDFDATFLTPWAMRFRRRSDTAHRIARDYERHIWRLQQENQELRQALNAMRAATGATHADADVDELRRERDALRELVRQYEQGKFIRLMRWWRGLGKTGA